MSDRLIEDSIATKDEEHVSMELRRQILVQKLSARGISQRNIRQEIHKQTMDAYRCLYDGSCGNIDLKPLLDEVRLQVDMWVWEALAKDAPRLFTPDWPVNSTRPDPNYRAWATWYEAKHGAKAKAEAPIKSAKAEAVKKGTAESSAAAGAAATEPPVDKADATVSEIVSKMESSNITARPVTPDPLQFADRDTSFVHKEREIPDNESGLFQPPAFDRLDVWTATLPYTPKLGDAGPFAVRIPDWMDVRVLADLAPQSEVMRRANAFLPAELHVFLEISKKRTSLVVGWKEDCGPDMKLDAYRRMDLLYAFIALRTWLTLWCQRKPRDLDLVFRDQLVLRDSNSRIAVEASLELGASEDAAASGWAKEMASYFQKETERVLSNGGPPETIKQSLADILRSEDSCLGPVAKTSVLKAINKSLGGVRDYDVRSELQKWLKDTYH